MRRVLWGFSLVLLFFTPGKGSAMKPAPAPELDVSSIHGRFRLTSKKEWLIFKATTEVKSENGTGLWKMPGFMGRWQWLLSPDGRTLVLFGSEPFGEMIALRPDSIIVKVHENGALLKTLTLKEVLGADPEVWAESRKLEILGGGWVAWRDIFGELKPDWVRRVLTLPVQDRDAIIIQY